jgi:TolB-like protein/Tfp pilus assembly protein PilF
LSFFNELKRRNVLRVAAAYVVAAWLVIQVVETIFPAFGFGDSALRIVTIVFGIGLIPTLVFAWAFEMTPEGLKKEKDVDRTQSITPHTGKKLDRMIMLVLALALGYFAFDKFVLDPQRDAAVQEQMAGQVEEARQQGRTEALVESYGDKSIAVLPFVNMSDDASNEFFSDGISEELLNLLAKITDLRVISRSSAFSYKGKDINLSKVAEELNVAHILEGSVRKAGNKVRITAQLIEARSDTHLWSETYDRELDDIFAIQDEISATVVEQLKVTLLGAAPHIKVIDPEAYTLFLKARQLGRQFTLESLEHSNTLYRQALAIDPDYADAWDGLASNYTSQAGRGPLSIAEGYQRARAAAEKALVIDPEYAPAYATLGWLAMDYKNDLVEAARHYERALELDPADTTIIGGVAMLLKSLGRLDESITLGEYFTARDPLNAVSHYNLGLSYLFAGRWADAIASYQTARRLSPEMIGAQYFIGTALLFQGDVQKALGSMQQESYEARRLIGLAEVHYALDERDAADAALAKLIAKYEKGWAYNIAHVLAFRNDADQAFEWLDMAVEYGDGGLSEILGQPEFDSIKSDPRWLLFLESIGKSPAQLGAIKFEVTLPK